MIAKSTFGFSINPVYRRREPTSLHFLSERVTFWVALLSVFAFVTGNMFGQHGWHVFWKSVLGESAEQTIVFTGTVPPVSLIPDYEKWSRFGGNTRDHTYRQVPADVLVPLPKYENLSSSASLQKVYMVDNLGTYDTGLGQGSHPGMDIAVPEGTPVLSIANGIVTKVGYDAGGFGNYIVIKHPRVPDPANSSLTINLYSIYAHLSAANIQEQDIVNKGAVIGTSGSTGFATGPHLHFQIDREEAPWHPYWPFTGTEAREAGLSMTQAVNSGLHRERGLENTVHPMLFVQSYSSGAPVQVASIARSSSSKATASRRTTVADRRLARLAKRNIVAVTTISLAPAAPSVPLTEHAAAAASASSAAPVVTNARTNVTSVTFRHPGSFGQERQWLSVEVRLLDSNGNEVTMPVFDRPLVLRTAYGKADFRPLELKASNFVDGKAMIEVLPLSNSTVVLQAMPLGSLSEPLRYDRSVATR